MHLLSNEFIVARINTYNFFIIYFVDRKLHSCKYLYQVKQEVQGALSRSPEKHV